jgi:integrase
MTGIETEFRSAIATARHALEQFNEEPLVASKRGGPRLSPWWRVRVQASEVAQRWHRLLLEQPRDRFYATLDRAELKRVRLHDLRHVFGTILVQAFPLSDVKAYMGHADVATTMIYVHHIPQINAAAKLARIVDAETVSPDVSRTEPISHDLGGQQVA